MTVLRLLNAIPAPNLRAGSLLDDALSPETVALARAQGAILVPDDPYWQDETARGKQRPNPNVERALDQALKNYLLDRVETTGGAWKPTVRAATTVALPAHTRSGNVLTANANGALAAQDGATLVDGDLLLVKNEGGGSHLENGIYSVAQGSVSTPWALTRASWFDASSEVAKGAFIQVTEGALHGQRWFVLSTSDPITLNTTALSFHSVLGYATIGGTKATVVGAPDAPSGLFFPRTASDQPFSGMAVAAFDFYGTTDQVLTIGHNWNAAGRIDGTKAALQLQQELAFETIADGPVLAEWFSQMTFPGGAVIRGVGVTYDYGTLQSNWGLAGHGSWLNSAGVQRAIFAEDGLITHLGSATGSLWLAGQDRILMSGSLQNGTAAGMFYASSIVGHGTNTMYSDVNGAWARWYHGSPIIGFMPGGLLRGTIDATAWNFTHRLRLGYTSNEINLVTLSGNVTDWAIPNFGIITVVLYSGGGVTRLINSLAGAGNGFFVVLINIDTVPHTIVHNSGLGAASNQFLCPNNANRSHLPNEMLFLCSINDTIAGSGNKWRVSG
jgi:hypothetical protein